MPPAGAVALVARAEAATELAMATAAVHAQRAQLLELQPEEAAQAAQAWRERCRTAERSAPVKRPKRCGLSFVGAAKCACVKVAHHKNRAFWHPQRSVLRCVFASLHPGGTVARATCPEALERVHQKGTKVNKLTPCDVAVAVHALVRGGARKQTCKCGEIVGSVARPASTVGRASCSEVISVAYRVGRRPASRQVCCQPCITMKTKTRRLQREADTLRDGWPQSGEHRGDGIVRSR